MISSGDKDLKNKIKQLIIDECSKDIKPDDINDNIPLFSQESGLELDSVDALQISTALSYNFNVKITDSKDFRRKITTINEIADFIRLNEK